MLRVPWSKVTSIGDKLLQVLRALGVFQGSILRVTARTGSISAMITLNTARTRRILGFDTLKYCCTPSIVGFITLEYSLYSIYLGILYCSYLKFSEFLGISDRKNPIHGVFQVFIFWGTCNTRSIPGFYLYSKVLRVRVLLGVFYSEDEVFLGSILAILVVLRVI